MRHTWLVLLVFGACTHAPVDDDRCEGDQECDGDAVCSDFLVCKRPIYLRTLNVRWTLEGTMPTSAEPGRCAEIGRFVISGSQGAEGFAREPACADGSLELSRLPINEVEIHAYTIDGNVDVDGITVLVPDGTEAITLDLQIR